MRCRLAERTQRSHVQLSLLPGVAALQRGTIPEGAAKEGHFREVDRVRDGVDCGPTRTEGSGGATRVRSRGRTWDVSFVNQL